MDATVAEAWAVAGDLRLRLETNDNISRARIFLDLNDGTKGGAAAVAGRPPSQKATKGETTEEGETTTAASPVEEMASE